MNINSLKKIKKLYFGYEEISRVMGISQPSARVTACRYVKYGLLVRVKRGIYLLRERWDTLSREEQFIIANLVQTPSYVSLLTALSYYEVSTQMVRDFTESIVLKRSLFKAVDGKDFAYFKIKREFYTDFLRKNDFFIAKPEKAFVDAIYLKYLGCYDFDLDSIDFSKLDINIVADLISRFPGKISGSLQNYGYF